MKRGIDVLVSFFGIVVLSPFLFLIGVLIRSRMGSPVLYRQTRTGLHGKRFQLLKFRTMRLVPGDDAARITRLGGWLRVTSLDELPQFWNVLRGDMSLIGPRPLLPDYLPKYSLRQAKRHEVRPGITGWAQVNGRNAASWDERLELDVWYVEHRSISLDLRIFLRTLRTILKREGISQAGHATMPPFPGSSHG